MARAPDGEEKTNTKRQIHKYKVKYKDNVKYTNSLFLASKLAIFKGFVNFSGIEGMSEFWLRLIKADDDYDDFL